MIDKSLIKQRFKRSFKTYDDNAIIQKITAANLISMLGSSKNFDKIFETGSATGILTKEIKKNLVFKSYSANDIVENSEVYIKKIIENAKFISGDIEEIIVNEKYNLIISNACLQWCEDIYKTLDKLISMLDKNGVLAFTVFGKDNLKEIKEVFSLNNSEEDPAKLIEFLGKYGEIIEKEEINTIEFTSFTDVLKHLKYTGVNAIKRFTLTKSTLKEYEKKYIKLCNNTSPTLTYNPIYFVLHIKG